MAAKKLLILSAALLACEAFIIPDLFGRPPSRIWTNYQNQPQTSPNNWNYQIVDGRPVISGYPNPSSFVSFQLNPQTGLVEQTQIISPNRPGRPVVNMLQNMMNVAGRFFSQLSNTFNNALGGAIQATGQFGQDIKNMNNPPYSLIQISQPSSQGSGSGASEPVQQANEVPNQGSRPPVVLTPSPSPFPTLSTTTFSFASDNNNSGESFTDVEAFY